MNELKQIEGYEGLYSVDRKGNVYSHKRKKFLTPSFSVGHRIVNLYKDGKSKCFFVHRLVAQAFIANPNNLPVVHHIDGNGENNCIENLQWCTQKENVAHCIESGKHGKSWGTQVYKKYVKKEKGNL